jgi:glycosyltransferase involved in cell wall biosynthesis
MKLGLVLQMGSTGAVRYTGRLMESMIANDPTLSITLFHGINTDSLGLSKKAFIGNRICFQKLRANKTYTHLRPVRLIQKKIEKAIGILPEELDKKDFAKCDVIFFAWPYSLSPPSLKVPMAFIPHDFIYAQNFGVSNPNTESFNWQRHLHRLWFEKAKCVVSSKFVASQIKTLFGESHSADIIPLSRLSPYLRLENKIARERVHSLGVPEKYILCVNNMSVHKNLGQLFGAFFLVKQRFPNLKLVLCGYETEHIHGISDSKHSVMLTNKNEPNDIIGLGVVSDYDLTCLMQCSAMVVNPSLCEAGNGSGIDAWSLGVPVAMSNIPAFLEHLEFLGVYAETFDPREASDIADAILKILTDEKHAENMVQKSYECMKKYDWNHVATRYIDFFKKITGLT